MKRLFVRPYLAVLRVYFGRAKLPLSRLVDRCRPRAGLRLPPFASLEDYAAWMEAHLRWRPDRLAGLLDVFPSLEHAGWQLERRGFIADDCDGLAYVAAQGARQLADDPRDVYVVTLVLDPQRAALREAAHVICVFRAGDGWRVVSSGRLCPETYPTFWEAVRRNPYVGGREVRFVEIRDAGLARAPAPGS